MTKTDIGIYRGLKEKFDPEVHVGFFITTDTGELLLGDQSLGQTISGWEINDGVLMLKLNTGRDIRVTFPEATETVKGLLSAADKAQLNALQANLDSKVDKVTGKSLLADSEIEKLAGLPNSTELTNSIATAKAAGDNAQSDLNAHKQNKSNPHEVTKAQVGLGNVTNDAQVKRSEMGVANGVATLDADGKVPASQLPSYVDDIIDVYATYSKSDTGVLSNVTLYLDAAHTQLVTGEAGKIYQNIADGEPQYQFRWTGTIFSQTGASSLILGEVTGTAYDGAKGKANADNIAKIKGTSLSHIKDAAPVTTTADKVSINYECFEGNQYGAAGTDHTADIPAATTAKAGVMSSADKAKLEDLNSKLVVADEEDVTAVDGKIKFKDRDTTNGMGYKILRLPENGILTQDMINEANTIYEIRYNFDLNGQEILVPKESVLKFTGGSLSNGTITGNNTTIQAPNSLILKSIKLGYGSFKNINFVAEWFESIQDALNNAKSVVLTNASYKLTAPIALNGFNCLYSEHQSVLNFNIPEGEYCINLGFQSKLSGIDIIIQSDSGGIKTSIYNIYHTRKNNLFNVEKIELSEAYSAVSSNLVEKCNIFCSNPNNNYAICSLAEGTDQSFENPNASYGIWGASYKNINIFGPFQYSIYLDNGNKAEATKPSWATELTFQDIKIMGSTNGIFIGKNDEKTFEEGISNGSVPGQIVFSRVSYQYIEGVTNRFANLQSCSNVVFEDCVPWDYYGKEIKPYLINPNDTEFISILGIESTSKFYDFSQELTNGKVITMNIQNKDGKAFYLDSFIDSSNPVYLTDMLELPEGTYTTSSNFDTNCLAVGEVYSRIFLRVSKFINNGKLFEIFNPYRIYAKDVVGYRFMHLWGTSEKIKLTSSYWNELQNKIRLQDESWGTDGSVSYNSHLNLKLRSGDNSIYYKGYTSDKTSGSSENLPLLTSADRDIGFSYFNITLNRPVYWNGTTWIDPAEDSIKWRTIE